MKLLWNLPKASLPCLFLRLAFLLPFPPHQKGLNAGIGEGDIAPEKAFGYTLFRPFRDFETYKGGRIPLLSGTGKRKLAGSLIFSELGEVGVAHSGRYKDPADLLRVLSYQRKRQGNEALGKFQRSFTARVLGLKAPRKRKLKRKYTGFELRI